VLRRRNLQEYDNSALNYEFCGMCRIGSLQSLRTKSKPSMTFRLTEGCINDGSRGITGHLRLLILLPLTLA
jgi:hypothetical protein